MPYNIVGKRNLRKVIGAEGAGASRQDLPHLRRRGRERRLVHVRRVRLDGQPHRERASLPRRGEGRQGQPAAHELPGVPLRVVRDRQDRRGDGADQSPVPSRRARLSGPALGERRLDNAARPSAEHPGDQGLVSRPAPGAGDRHGRPRRRRVRVLGAGRRPVRRAGARACCTRSTRRRSSTRRGRRASRRASWSPTRTTSTPARSCPSSPGLGPRTGSS